MEKRCSNCSPKQTQPCRRIRISPAKESSPDESRTHFRIVIQLQFNYLKM
jgi:hypothetical protein